MERTDNSLVNYRKFTPNHRKPTKSTNYMATGRSAVKRFLVTFSSKKATLPQGCSHKYYRCCAKPIKRFLVTFSSKKQRSLKDVRTNAIGIARS